MAMFDGYIERERVKRERRQASLAARSQLMAALLKEIDTEHNGITHLYAKLLASALVAADDQLKRKYTGALDARNIAVLKK
jgi:hypothetical protein